MTSSASSQAGHGGELYCPSCERVVGEGERCPDDGTRLVRLRSAVDPFLGRELDGRYTILERLGQGGMGTVYRAHQHSVGRDVAIKVVTPALVSSPDVIKRFLRECKLASRLAHPNAVGVLDFGQTDDGVFFLVMELVTGRTLDDIMARERQLRPERVIRIGVQICDALEGAHGMHIVHRDLKPSNVMLLATGRDLVKVLDFGLAKSLSPDSAQSTMTGTGALMGTPAYMPPELATGQECDGRADLYSLGCILYTLATGRPPFMSDSVHELVMMHASEPAPPMPGPPALARVVDRLLLKDPDERFPTAAATREALEHALAHLHAKAPPPGPSADTEISLGPFPARTAEFAHLQSEPGANKVGGTTVPRGADTSAARLAVLDTYAGDGAGAANAARAASRDGAKEGRDEAAGLAPVRSTDVATAVTVDGGADASLVPGGRRPRMLLMSAIVAGVAAIAVVTVIALGGGDRGAREGSASDPATGAMPEVTGSSGSAAEAAGSSSGAAGASGGSATAAQVIDAGVESASGSGSGSGSARRPGTGSGGRVGRETGSGSVTVSGSASGSGSGSGSGSASASGSGSGSGSGTRIGTGTGSGTGTGTGTGTGSGRVPGSPDQETPPF